ncbi:MAG TPA: cysteine dioxygenase family protein [Chloroflexia bacterium]|jgi:predicted metal-dependent enzyme (double-stranded beta helix superfamily)|nr:cysteine dioxygenase family protein [Chloroflexia bacterium]
MITLPTPHKVDLPELAALPADMAVREVASLLPHLVRDKQLLGSRLLGLLERPHGVDPWVAARWRGEDDSYALQLFVWPAHAASAIHDHSCWGAICAASGTLLETRYRRLDDGSQANQARLKMDWQRALQTGDLASTLMPYDGGIHRVCNPGDRTVLSIHLYGPSGPIDGRDYDPRYDYVCDRLVGD